MAGLGKLKDTAIRAAKPEAKPYKLTDGGGLFLFVKPNGSKLWRMKYRLGGAEKLLSIGTYPLISLKEARDRRDDARRQLSNGVDPCAVKQATKKSEDADSFAAIALEWFAKHEARWSDSYQTKTRRILDKDLLPWIGKRPITGLKPLDVLKAVQRLEHRSALESAHTAMQITGRVFRHAVATGRAERDVTADLRGALPPIKVQHRAALVDPKDVGGLLRAIDGFKGSFPVGCALKLLPILFCRPGELRQMEWSEVDLDAGTWSIAAEKMKMRQAHLVPLPTQAVAILAELHALTGHGRYVFPGGRDPKRAMSNMAINAAIRRLGIDTQKEHTGHGFRATARTLLHEVLGFTPEIIEHQLAHRVPDALGAAYNRTKFIDARTKMMQTWANYLDQLKSGANVIKMPKRA